MYTKLSSATPPSPPQNHPQENPVGKGRKTLHGRTTQITKHLTEYLNLDCHLGLASSKNKHNKSKNQRDKPREEKTNTSRDKATRDQIEQPQL
jgi:hypothetical protein